MKSETRSRIRFFPLIIAILIPLFVGVFSSLLTSADMDVYSTMSRPPLAPPSWLFPIVWTILYVVMGIASYLIYTSNVDDESKRTALRFYGAQLIMNFFWSIFFFTYSQYFLAWIWLMIMWVLIIICVFRFLQIHMKAGLMMGALLLWTTFAAYLNFMYFIKSVTG